MANSWAVETERLTSSANTLGDKIASYDAEWAKLYTEVENLKSSQWTGIASDAFNSKLESYRNDFEELTKVLNSYKEFLITAAERYAKTEESIKDAAGNLNAGM